MPLTNTVRAADGTTNTSVLGALYLNYSITDYKLYREDLIQYIWVTQLLTFVLAI